MAAETGFMIDDVLYETPSLDSFTMQEAQVLYDYSGLTIEDFVAPEDDEDDDTERLQKLKNPGFMRALMHIAYQRGNPKLSEAKVKALISNANMVAALEHLAGEDVAEGDDALPPASTTKPEQPSPNGSVESNANSGNDSQKSSDPPAVPLKAITTIGSATPSTVSPIADSVA